MSAVQHCAIMMASALVGVVLVSGCEGTPDSGASTPASRTSSPGGAPPAPSTTLAPRHSEAATAPDDVCQLVSKADVSGIVHYSITTAKPSRQEGERVCDYDNPGGTGTVTIGLSDTSEAAFDSDSENYPQVRGVGDGAYDDSVLLYVLHADTKISIAAGGGDNVRIPLARKVIERLDQQATATPTPSS